MTRALARVLVAFVVTVGAAGCGDIDPCAGVSGTCLAVHVDPSSAVQRVDQLDFAITFGANSGSTDTRGNKSGTTELPIAVAVELGTLAAPAEMVRVQVSGLVASVLAGQGTISTTIANGEHLAVHVKLAAVVCMDGGLYCGGDKLAGDPNVLYRCNGTAAPTPRGMCPNGCQVQPGQDDTCMAGGGACMSGAFYCGGDKLAGDPRTLYRCNGASDPTVSMECPSACVIRANQNDICQ
jgi:hypothetical protein